MEPARIELQLLDRRELTGSSEMAGAAVAPICEFTFCSPQQKELPAFEPGAHITLRTPSGAMRRYTLVGDPADHHHYRIAVKREAQGRGGSVSLHDQLQIGDTVEAEPPGNSFPLLPAQRYLFIAGGIGITPVVSMIRALQHAGNTAWQLVYCTRSAPQTAFLDELGDPLLAGQVTIHHDEGDPARVFDLWPLLENPDKTHIYCCGPGPLMQEVRDMTGHWPMDAVHFEDFSPVDAVRPEDSAFTVRLDGSGQTVQVPADQTILESLRSAGISVRSSCESGTCGTCKTRYLGGRVDHRDLCLTGDERAEYMMICVSRCLDDELLLAHRSQH